MTIRSIALSILFIAISLAAHAQEANQRLLEAAAKGDVAAAQAALDAGADVNARDDYGVTALMFAARENNAPVATLLIQKGADVNAVERFYGMNAISEASRRGHPEMVVLLLESGAAGGIDLMRSAITRGDAAIVKALLGTGKLSPVQLKTGLRHAIETNQQEIAKLFENAGVTLTTQPSSRAPAANAESQPDAERLAALARMNEKIAIDPKGEIAKPTNWPMFRGPQASGVADGQHPPTAWDATKNENIRWATAIPGLGHSSPIVWGDRLYITTAVSGKQEDYFRHGLYGDVDSVEDDTVHKWIVMCLDKKSGEVIWEHVAHEGVPAFKRHMKSTHANSTPATDGKRVVAFFASEGMHCYDMDGKLLWKKDLGKLDSGWFYDASFQWGFAASPIIYKDMIMLQCDVQSDSFIAAYDIEDGREIWKTTRDEIPSWGTPNVYESETRAEIVTNGTKAIRGYDAMTGKELWTLTPNSEVTAPTPVFGHGLMYVTSGYRPVQPIYAIRPGQTGDLSLPKGESSNGAIAWSVDRGGPYMPTPLVYGDYLYTCANNGILACYNAKSGEVVYKKRLGHMGGGYSGSPVAADGRLYFPSEDGEVFVVRAGPEYELLATNPMGEIIMTTPAISEGMIFVRTLRHVYGIGSD